MEQYFKGNLKKATMQLDKVMAAEVTIIDHPLVQHKLTLMHQAHQSTAKFGKIFKEVGILLAYELNSD